MSKTINVPSSLGSPYVEVWVNNHNERVFTGKEQSIGNAIHEVVSHAMEKEVALESPDAENFRVFFTTDGSKVTCNRSFAEVIDMAKKGANIIARYEENGDTHIMNSTFISKAGTKMTFSCPVASSEGLKCLTIHFYSDESCVRTLSFYGG